MSKVIVASTAGEALRYANRGLPVFPVNGKVPLTPHGLLDATTDDEIIRDWWQKWPDAGIGMATGSRSGLIAIDIDPRHGGDRTFATFEHEHCALPQTLESKTGGGGRHLFFTLRDGLIIRNSVAKLGPGLDVRGEFGYVVLPPSLHVSGAHYEWLNEAPLHLFQSGLLRNLQGLRRESHRRTICREKSLRDGATPTSHHSRGRCVGAE